MRNRDDILLAAAQEFASGGYMATTFSTIASRVGMHRNALQHYIASKPELAAEIAWKPFKNGSFLAPDAPLTGGVETILELVAQVSALYLDDVFARASMRLMDEHHLIPAELPLPFKGWIDPIERLLREGVEAKSLAPDTDVEDLAWRLVSAFAGVRLMSEVLGEMSELSGRVRRTTEDLLRAHDFRPNATS